jgi:hypothetical protein
MTLRKRNGRTKGAISLVELYSHNLMNIVHHICSRQLKQCCWKQHFNVPYIVMEILRNNSHSVFDVLIHNQSSAYAIYKLLCLIESNTLNETTLLFTYSLKLIIQEMWERDKTWSFSAF